MTKDNLYLTEVREKLMNGVRRSASVIAGTMGTAGSNAIVEALENPGYGTSNDGATLLGAMRFADPREELGRKILYEAVSRANRASGDGSSTTTVLTSAILEEGMKYLGDVQPMELKRSLEECIPVIEEAIKAQKKDITVDNVAAVASISAESVEIGNRIQEIYQKIGKDGIISWDISKLAEDSYTIGTGITINGATVVAPYMLDNGRERRIKNPLIALIRRKINTGADFATLFYTLNESEIKEIVIFCDEIDLQAITHFANTQQGRGFKAVVIKMPILWRDEWWEDVSKATGAKIIDALSGIKISEIRQEHLGTVELLAVNKEDTFIDGIKDISEHISTLQATNDDSQLLRASRLNTKTARYSVGGYSDQAIYYRRLKVEDAINSATCALQGGVVPGGGIALYNAVQSLPNTIGGQVLQLALEAPMDNIIANTGKLVDKSSLGEGMGFDSRTGKLVDMFEAGIVDATLVVLNAIRSAIGVAATILTANSVILLPEKDDKQTK